jgi:hypothetical protein
LAGVGGVHVDMGNLLAGLRGTAGFVHVSEDPAGLGLAFGAAGSFICPCGRPGRSSGHYRAGRVGIGRSFLCPFGQ